MNGWMGPAVLAGGWLFGCLLGCVARKRLGGVTGGARSGKSRHALALADTSETNAFIATAEAVDEEMTRRIEKHWSERGELFQTIEAPIHQADAIKGVDSEVALIVVDCLTVWLGNLQVRDDSGQLALMEIEALLSVLKDPPCSVVAVTNEVGMGIVSLNEMARTFRDTAGRLNQRVAEIADQVILMVSGIPVVIKS